MASKKRHDWHDKRAPHRDDEPINWPAPAGLFTPGSICRRWRNTP